jgi:hypothetical protein
MSRELCGVMAGWPMARALAIVYGEFHGSIRIAHPSTLTSAKIASHDSSGAPARTPRPAWHSGDARMP